MAISLAIARSGRVDGTCPAQAELALAQLRAENAMLRREVARLQGQRAGLGNVPERDQVEEVRARLAAIVENSSDAITSLALDGTITSWNPGAERLYGYSAQEIIGRSFTVVVPPERADEAAHLRVRVLRGERLINVETVRQHKDGRLIPISLSSAPIHDASGAQAGVAFIIRDISERVRAEEVRRRSAELEEQNRRMAEASRLKSDFLANMSHELRTPLNAIMGFAELLHDGKAGAVSPEQKEFLGDILTSSRHLLQIISDILDLSKVELGKTEFRPEPIEPAQLVAEVCAIVRTLAARKRLRIAMQIDPALGPVVLDPMRLKQVLYNYLSNAIKFSGKGGTITIGVTAKGADSVRLSVQDSGIGISTEDQARLFVEFEQLTAGRTTPEQGTGLGLALTRRIVEAQGGRVGVSSAPGQGSIFYAVLPRLPVEQATHRKRV